MQHTNFHSDMLYLHLMHWYKTLFLHRKGPYPSVHDTYALFRTTQITLFYNALHPLIDSMCFLGASKKCIHTWLVNRKRAQVTLFYHPYRGEECNWIWNQFPAYVGLHQCFHELGANWRGAEEKKGKIFYGKIQSLIWWI